MNHIEALQSSITETIERFNERDFRGPFALSLNPVLWDIHRNPEEHPRLSELVTLPTAESEVDQANPEDLGVTLDSGVVFEAVFWKINRIERNLAVRLPEADLLHGPLWFKRARLGLAAVEASALVLAPIQQRKWEQMDNEGKQMQNAAIKDPPPPNTRGGR